MQTTCAICRTELSSKDIQMGALLCPICEEMLSAKPEDLDEDLLDLSELRTVCLN